MSDVPHSWFRTFNIINIAVVTTDTSLQSK